MTIPLHRTRRAFAAAGAITAVTLLAACSEPATSSDLADAADDDEYVIGVSMITSTRGFHSELYRGIQAAAEEHGVTIITTDAQGDVVQQLDDVSSLINRGVDAILIAPVDESGSVPAFEDADAAGVPVVAVARDADTDLKAAYVGAEWENYGKELAAWACEQTGGTGKVALIKGPSGASHVNELDAGYTSYIESDCPGLEVVFEANAQSDGADPGLTLAQDALVAQPDLDVITVHADDTAMGVIQALSEQNRLQDVLVTGFNGEPDAFESIRDGQLDATYALRPYRYGETSIEAVLDLLGGEELPALVPIETILVDQETIGDYEESELN